MGFWDLGFGVWGSGFRIEGLFSGQTGGLLLGLCKDLIYTEGEKV